MLLNICPAFHFLGLDNFPYGYISWLKHLALNDLIFGLYWPDSVSKHGFQDNTYDIVFKMLVYV
jgi:hypothetical protein